MCFYTAGEIYFLRWEFQFLRHFPSDPKFFHSWREIGQLWIYRSQQFYDRELCTVKLIRYWGFSHLRLKNKPVHRRLPSLGKKSGEESLLPIRFSWFRLAKWPWNSAMREMEWPQTTDKKWVKLANDTRKPLQ